LPFPQDECGSFVLAWPGGVPPLLGHGGCAFALLPDAAVGSGFGFLVGLAVGLGVGSVVGRTVGWGVGAAVGAAVGGGVGSLVAAGWLGRGVAGVPGAPVGLAGTTGDATTGVVATAVGGLGLTSVAEGVADGEGAGAVSDGVAAGVSPAGADWVAPALGVLPPLGVAVGTTAIWLGPPLALARCCSSKPPMPMAIVARKIFRTPRLRMSRAR
jgi:hypothetical protein